jgi:hypothetical protein
MEVVMSKFDMEIQCEEVYEPTGEDWADYERHCEETEDEPYEMSDVEADADTLASAGWGTDEDYGYYGEDY